MLQNETLLCYQLRSPLTQKATSIGFYLTVKCHCDVTDQYSHCNNKGLLYLCLFYLYSLWKIKYVFFGLNMEIFWLKPFVFKSLYFSMMYQRAKTSISLIQKYQFISILSNEASLVTFKHMVMPYSFINHLFSLVHVNYIYL